MSFTERAGLIPVLLLTGCAQPTVYTGPPSGIVVDNMLSRSAADISAMQYRVHQTGLAAQRPASIATGKPRSPLQPGTTTASALTDKPAGTSPVSVAGAGPADGFVRQDGAAPTLRSALRKIIPPGQTVVFDKAVLADEPELWRWIGNDRWRYVVDKMLTAHGLRASVNEEASTVTVEPAPSTQGSHAAGKSILPSTQDKFSPGDKLKVSTLATIGKNPFRGDTVVAAPSQDKPTDASKQISRIPSVSANAQLRHWRIEPGSTLKDWLYSQANAETCTVPGIKNWTIAWLTPTNYRVDGLLNFDGSFREMLNQLFILYGTAKVPLYAGTRAAQCILVVNDKEVQ